MCLINDNENKEKTFHVNSCSDMSKKFSFDSVKGGNVPNTCVARQNCTTINTVVSFQSNLLQCLPKLHPSVTKKQKHWEAVEMMWLEFLSDFTLHAEGQLAVPKVQQSLCCLCHNCNMFSPHLVTLCVEEHCSCHFEGKQTCMLVSGGGVGGVGIMLWYVQSGRMLWFAGEEMQPDFAQLTYVSVVH